MVELSAQKGKRNLAISSMNTDMLRTNNTINTVVNHLREHNIDTACIQETPNGGQI